MIIVTSIVPRTMPGFDFPILFLDGFHFLFKLQQMASRWFLFKLQPNKLIRCDLKSWDQSVSRPDAARGVESVHNHLPSWFLFGIAA